LQPKKNFYKEFKKNMSYKIHLSPEAQLDFDISFEYYLEISPSIALNFKNEFVEALEKLEANLHNI
jgi:hypothetical protein